MWSKVSENNNLNYFSKVESKSLTNYTYVWRLGFSLEPTCGYLLPMLREKNIDPFKNDQKWPKYCLFQSKSLKHDVEDEK